MCLEDCQYFLKKCSKILAATERVQDEKMYDTLFWFTDLLKV